MHQRTQELPVTMKAPGMKVHNAFWGGMAIGYLELPAGTDFTRCSRGCPMMPGNVHTGAM